ncbi:MAG TPA: ABC transporter ATP-binding protein [Dehalococcoidia bacterium]|nr:ABC transporter ATP-binding protein [Dehalococcoidia bacterium]
MTDTVIEARALRKSYGDFQALKGIDLAVRAGEVFCLLGPNGAGKTTTVEILEGHRDYDAGEVLVLGHDPARAGPQLRTRIGIVLQKAGVERFLTVEEVIELFRGYYPHPRALDEVLRIVGLEEKRASLVRKLSGGQVRRLDLALALAGDPDLLFLDEPTSGFDPEARRGAWEMIAGLRNLGKTILLTTHDMEEAERLSDRLAVIANGRIVAEGTVASLREAHAGTVISFRAPAEGLLASVRDACRIEDGRVTIETDEPTRVLHEVTRLASEAGIELDELRVLPTSLEDIYLSLTRASRPAHPESLP